MEAVGAPQANIELKDLERIDAILPFVPKLLVNNISQDYVECLNMKETKVFPSPSIVRFRGALLFVDISGFTILSNKVAIDEFQSIINAYFSLLLGVCDKHDGDVIKFAGDAVFILWSVPVNGTDADYGNCIRKAAKCGEEINRTCCKYKVKVDADYPHLTAINPNEIKIGEFMSKGTYYLNVHSSLTCGEIDLVNVGADGRWECFLVGEPVNQLVDTIDQAPIGHMVMTTACHDIISREEESKRFTTADVAGKAGDKNLLPCGCCKIAHNCVQFELSGHNSITSQHDEMSNHPITEMSGKSIIENMIMNISPTVTSRLNLKELKKDLYYSLVGHVHEAARYILYVSSDLDCHLSHSEAAWSELRSVATIFIKIPIENLPEPGRVNGSGKTESAKLLARLQHLMEVCLQKLKAHGGQLRQFIIDDKGCVCIGNFGLHEATTRDDCASAVRASQEIESALCATGTQVSIGVTHGTAYCGLVGSTWRSEYTVMGTCVNLAARLMAAASKNNGAGGDKDSPGASSATSELIPLLGNIRCDLAVKKSDRLHSYVALSAVLAKGYADPVPTFRPIRQESYESAEMISAVDGYTFKSPMRSSACFGGRLGEMHDSLEFLFESQGAKLHTVDTQAKILVVVGPESIGTEAFLDSMQGVLNAIETPLGNICFRGRARQTASTTRFSMWKSLFADLLSRLGQFVVKNTSANAGNRALPAKLVALEFINNRLPPDIREFAPLLAHFGLVPKSSQGQGSASIMRLTSSLKLEKTVLYLASAFEIAAEYLKKFSSANALVFLIDDMHNIDSSSWQLVEAILNKLRNVYFVVSYCTKDNLKDRNGTGEMNADPTGGATDIDNYELTDNDDYDSASVSQLSADGSSTQGGVYSALESSGSMTGSSIMNYIMSIYNGDKRKARCLHLGPLGEEAVFELLVSTYNTFFKCEGDICLTDAPDDLARTKKIVTKLHHATEGHPVSVQEVAASITQQGKCSTPEEFFDRLEAVLSKIKSNNIEDLVYYKFDKLSAECQLVLKAASVIASTGLNFSALMIASVLGEDPNQKAVSLEAEPELKPPDANPAPVLADTVISLSEAERSSLDNGEAHAISETQELQNTNAFDMEESSKKTSLSRPASKDSLQKLSQSPVGILEMTRRTLRTILKTSNFLHHSILSDENDDATGNSRSVDDYETILKDFDDYTLFNFSSLIYQAPIYTMLLNHQKASFHYKFASYLESEEIAAVVASNAERAALRQIIRDNNASMGWQMQGMHWNYAGSWMKASACFFKAAHCLVAEGAFVDATVYFSWAYNTFQSLRQKFGDTNLHRVAVDSNTGVCTLVRSLSQSRGASSAQQGSLNRDSADLDDTLSAHSASTENRSMRTGSILSSRGEESAKNKSKASLEDSSDQKNQLLENALGVTLNIVGEPLQGKNDINFEANASKALYRLFMGDVLSLETTIMMLIRFSQNLLLTQEDQTLVSVILKDALHVIMLSRKSSIKKAALRLGGKFIHKPFLPSVLYAQLAANGEREKQGYDSMTGNQKFYLRDMSMIFPILSTLSMQYITGFFRDDDEFTKLAALEKTFIAIAEDYGQAIHIMRALAISEWRLSSLHQYHGVTNCVKRIRQLYEFEAHSSRFISVYATDVGMQALVNGIKNYILLGDFSSANESYAYVREQLSKLKHINSLELSSIPLCGSLVLMEMLDEALLIFFEYFAVQADSDAFSLFAEQAPFIALWLLEVATLPAKEKERLKNSISEGSWVNEAKFLTSDLNPIPTRRTQAVSSLEAAGMGIDNIKAKLCLIEAKKVLKKTGKSVAESDSINKTAMSICLAALFFLDATFDSRNISNETNTICSLWIKSEVLLLLAVISRSMDREASEEEAYSILALDAVLEAFAVTEETESSLLGILTGRHADAVISKLSTGQMSSGRMIKQGRVAELSAKSVLDFPNEKTKPLLDFSRSLPISSLRKDEVAVEVKVTPDQSTTVTYWSRPWFKIEPRKLDF